MLISYLKYIVNGSHRNIIDANDESPAFSLIPLEKENRLSLRKNESRVCRSRKRVAQLQSTEGEREEARIKPLPACFIYVCN